jgi:DNA mismatch endonuclease (patch repair protein)
LLPDRRRSVDIAFMSAKVACFVDGCFWHGCPQHRSRPKTNAAFWRAKIASNEARDRDTDRQLREHGWYVVRVWEHDRQAAKKVEKIVRRRLASKIRAPRPARPAG